MADVLLTSTEEVIQLTSVSGASTADITSAVNAHSALATGVHGVGASTVASATSVTAAVTTHNALATAHVDVAHTWTAGQTFTGLIYAGANVPSADDTAINVGRNFPTGVNSHAYHDESTLAMTAASTGYASFDAQYSVSSNQSFSHIAGFQARPTFSGGGVVSEFRGYWSFLTHNGAGTISAAKNINVIDAGGTGTITNQYGLYVDNLTRGATANYAVFTAGTTPSWFGGAVEFNSTLRVDDIAAFGNVAPNTGYQVYIASNLDATKTAAFGALAIAPINLNTGSTYGLFFSNIAQNNTLAAIGNNFVYGLSGIAGVYATGANSAARYTYAGRFQTNFTSSSPYTSTAIGGVALLIDAISINGAGTISIGETVGIDINNQGTSKTPNSYAIRVASQSGSGTASFAFYSSAGRHRFGDSTALISFYGATPQTQQILATGAGATADNIISLLQLLGLCRQS